MARKNVKKTTAEQPVAETPTRPTLVADPEPEVMPALNEIDMTGATVDREVASPTATEEPKGLYLRITGGAKRLMMLQNRSLRELFPTMVWVVSELRKQRPEAFHSEEGEKKTTVFITEESVMQKIIENVLEASQDRSATREDVERELSILSSKLDWYAEHGFQKTLSTDGFREEAKVINEKVIALDEKAGPDEYRWFLIKAAKLIDELETSSIENLEANIVRLMGAERAIPRIETIWEKTSPKDFAGAKKALLELRKQLVGNQKVSAMARESQVARKEGARRGFQPSW